MEKWHVIAKNFKMAVTATISHLTNSILPHIILI